MVAAVLAAGLSVGAASAQTSPHARAMVTEHVSDSDLVTAANNTHPAARAGTDLGAVADDLALPHVALLLKRAPEQQAALDKFLVDVQNPKSAEYHQFLSAAQFSDRFGINAADQAAVTKWLSSHGITVNGVNANLVMDVSATAGQLREAFHTEIHNLDVKGAKHFSNMSDPKFPQALAGALVGPVGLNTFVGHPLSVAKTHPQFTTTFQDTPFEEIVPGDLATIYNLTPLYSAGISGQGQTIGIAQDSDLFANTDWSTFRKEFALSRQFPKGNLEVVHPTGAVACTDPGVNGADGEAAIDVEWSSSAAPNATIEMASCSDSRASGAANFGGFIAMENLLNSTSFPMVWSISFGELENEVGAAGNLFINNLYALGAAEGVSIFVSSGDESAASSDADAANAAHGIAISGFTSTPNNVSVGGTDFGDTFLGEVAAYWNATNSASFSSAKSYIPEIPWNDSCASQLIYLSAGFSSAVGPNGYCNSAAANTAGEITTASGSGGPSGCATGTATTRGVVSGTCAGYAKPSWQSTVFGNPADGVRDIPDVSLFAANGVWGHFYVVCYSDTNTARTEGDAGPCNNDPSTWAGFGGTSVSSPIMAGIQALINQRTGSPQGNPNPTYYAIAAAEYGSSGNAACNSTLGNGAAKSCVFYDVTLGDIDVNCIPLVSRGTTVGTFNCFNAGGTEGALSVSNTVLEPAYPSTVGWDYATGIGTVNAFNLVMSSAWPTAAAE